MQARVGVEGPGRSFDIDRGIGGEGSVIRRMRRPDFSGSRSDVNIQGLGRSLFGCRG